MKMKVLLVVMVVIAGFTTLMTAGHSMSASSNVKAQTPPRPPGGNDSIAQPPSNPGTSGFSTVFVSCNHFYGGPCGAACVKCFTLYYSDFNSSGLTTNVTGYCSKCGSDNLRPLPNY